MKTELACQACHKTYPLESPLYRCPEDDYPLEVSYDYEKLAGTLKRSTFVGRICNMWRYKELLPIEDTSKIVTLNEGETALWKSTGLAKVLGLRNLYLKDETKNPTWSFKDRGTSVGVSKAREIGYQIVGCVSSGNMAASISTYAAHAGLRALVLLRTGVPIEKIVHMLICGAEVIAVDMPYPRIYRLGLELSKECGICWVHADAPMRIEGQKTSSFEICEQLGWEVPGKVVVPTSSGGNMSAHWKGWRDMYATKLIEEKPSMVAVQIAAAHPIYDAFRQGKDIVQPVVEGDTIATSICNPDPPSGLRVLRLLRESKGLVEVVDDDEILQAQKLLGRTEGIFAEPGGSSSIAGLKKLVDHGSIDRDETVVAVITGAGIKDTKSAIKVAGKPYTVSFESELRDLIATLFRKSEELH